MDFPSSETVENKTEKVLENCQEIAETVDPDYVSVLPEKLQNKGTLNEQQQDAKEHAIKKIKDIVRQQFALEMHLKEQEIETIDERIRQTRAALDRLRACVLARYYGMCEEDDLSSISRSSTWSKSKRVRRERANYLQSRHLSKAGKSLLENNTVSFSSSPLSFSSARDLGNANLSIVKTSSSHSTQSLSTELTNTGEKQFSELSLDKPKNPVSSSAFTCIRTENPAAMKLGINNGEKEKSSSLATVLTATDSSSSPGAVTGSKSNLRLISISKAASDKITNNSKEKSSMVNANKGQSYGSSVISGSHSNAVGSSGLGNHLSGCSNVKGIQLNASGNQSSVSLQLKETQQIACSRTDQLNASNILDTQTKVTRSQLSASSPEGTSKNGLGNQLSVSLDLKGIHANALKDISSQNRTFGSGSRFYVEKRIIIGNTSKYIAPEKREENDKATHKWMMYVRGPPDDPHINVYIQKVWFFLHPSYRPNDIIEVNKPPFHLTRRGWGEFPIRVQLHFVGSRNKRVDIIHELKLDKTYTGLQTLGAETVVDLEIDRKTFDDLGIPVSFEAMQDKEPVDSKADKDIINNTTTNPGTSKLKREYPSTNSSSSHGSESGPLPNNLLLKRPKIDTPISSVVSTPCGSQMSSRCASPVLTSKGSFPIEEGLEEHLHKFAEKIPLVTPKKDVVNLPFSARSAQEFLSWNIGKRRAAEWQRAGKIRARIKKCVDDTKATTKDVMIWCRKLGYTPREGFVMGSEVEYCKICGGLIKQDEIETSDSKAARLCASEKCAELSKIELSSLTPVNEIITQIEEKEKLLDEISRQKSKEEDTEIDVVSTSNLKKNPFLPTHQKLRLLTIPLTAEQQWVKDVCNDIGIGLRSVIMDGIEVHAVESILLAIAMKFIKNLMRTASLISAKTDSALDPKLVVPTHIYEAIQLLPSCDFLSNSYLGHASENEP